MSIQLKQLAYTYIFKLYCTQHSLEFLENLKQSRHNKKNLAMVEKSYSGLTLARIQAASHLANDPWRQQPGSCLLEGRYEH